MSAYLIVDTVLSEPDRYEAYKDKVPGLVEKHGGEYLVRGGEFEVIEGNWQPNRLVLFRFPDRQVIHNLLNEPDYQPLKELRHQVATSNIVAVDGL